MAGIGTKQGRSPFTTSAVSCSRLRHIQSILQSSDKSVPDGILCSLGIDSRYNLGCSELANYLFFGLYKRNHLDLNFSEFLEEVLDDVILLIKADSVHLYCNPVNYTSLLPYISHWRNLHIHCMTEAEYEDEEAAEEFKISSFVKMVQDCSHIGVAYSSQGYAQKFDMFVVEKWPIIQAYALEGIGGGGFFTMKHKLIDMSERLWQTYSRMDPISLDVLLTEDLAMFEKQWASFFSNFAIESYSSILELSEAEAGEPFRSYFSHGLLSSQITDKSNCRQPFLLFGGHSSQEHLDSYCFTFPSEGHQVRNTGPQGAAAKHMVVQCVSPKGPLACARTYFFGTTHIPCFGTGREWHRKTELTLLSALYSSVVQAVLDGIKGYCSTFRATKAWGAAEKSFRLSLDRHGLAQYKRALLSKTTFNIQAVNNEGRVIPLESVESRFLVKTAFMAIYDIPHPLGGSEVLGSLVFSESFLESRLLVQEQDGSVSSDSCFTVLTADIPRYVSWLVDESDVKLSESVQQLLKEEEETCLGRALSVGDTAVVSSSGPLASTEEGKISYFSEGILFVHPHYGSVTLPMNLVSSLRFYQGDSSSTMAALFLEYKTSMLPFLPFQLRSSSATLAFGLLAGSKSRLSFGSQVLMVWQQQASDSGLIVQMVGWDQLSSQQKSTFRRLYDSQALAEPLDPLVGTPQWELEAFLQHFSFSSVGRDVVQSHHLEVLLSQREPGPRHCPQEGKIVMTILTGIPGSCKENLCSFLTNLNKSYGRWLVYRPPVDRCEMFCRAHFQRYLSSLLESHQDTGAQFAGTHPCKCRLLVLTPGYTDVADVVQALLTHPDPQTRDAFGVGAITACVEPLSSYMEHRYAFPKLLEQCSHGLVSSVVFTGLTQEPRHPVLKQLQQVLRATNPSAAFIMAEKGAVTRNEDVELILSESSFSEAQMLTARYLLYPGLSVGKFSSGNMSPTMNQQCVTFSRPIDRLRFMARCKELKPLRPDLFCGNIYHICGRVKFSDSDKTMEVSFSTVSGTLSLLPVLDGSILHTHGCSLQFFGVGLTEEGLKDWLRQCTQQKVAKKALKTKKTLTTQEIRTIHLAHRLDPLPAGYFYNGSQYVTFFGEKMTFHPLMEEFIDGYLEEANKEIERFNHQLEIQCQGDLFDP